MCFTHSPLNFSTTQIYPITKLYQFANNHETEITFNPIKDKPSFLRCIYMKFAFHWILSESLRHFW